MAKVESNIEKIIHTRVNGVIYMSYQNTVTAVQEEKIKDKFWNLNFFLLWQGQFVSAFGDTIYDLALGFWILAVTGSTGLMGVIMAASVIPRVFISAFAGTFVDRHDRKRILIYTDIIRGVAITFVGIAAIFGFIEIWMVFVAGIIMGACSCFFNPAVSSSIPDIVPESKLLKANSTFSLASSTTDIFGKVAGGFLYQILGAPIMFLMNGISYLFSAGTELFVKIPEVVRKNDKVDFLQEMKEGFRFISGFKGLKMLYINICFLNFFAVMGLILLRPYFLGIETFGPKLYGIVMGFSASGMFLGFLSLSCVNFKFKKSHIFSFTGVCSALVMIAIPFVNFFPLLALIFLINGFCLSIVNSLIQTTMQLIVPQELRGKVFGVRRMLSSALAPLAMAFGGILAEFIPIGTVIAGSYVILFILFGALSTNVSVRNVFDFDPKTQVIEDIM